MIVKQAMTRTSLKFFENDSIEGVAKTLLILKLKGGLVYNIRDEIVGCFSESDLLKGLIDGKRILSDVYQTEFYFLDELEELANVKFEDQYTLPVKNTHHQVTGFITKEQYLSAFAKISQIKLSQVDAIVDSAHNGILSIDQNGFITSMNPPAEELAMTTKEKAMGKFLTDVVVPNGLLEVVRTGKGHKEKYKVGNRLYFTHRNPIWNGDQIVGAVGVFQDISEIEFISNELDSFKQIVKELDTVLNNSSDGICIVDNKGNIIKMNQSFEELFYTNSQCTDTLKTPDIIEQMVQQVRKKGRQHHVMESNINDNSFILSAKPIKNRQSLIERIVINVKDMTEMDALRSELQKAKSILDYMGHQETTDTFVAQSYEMKQLLETVEQVSKVDVTALLTGESGVGKEEIAKLIQHASPRTDKPFIKVNCGAIPESLMESELFGYEGGAFTGALKNGKAGLFEQANDGTIFLDEIGEIPPQLQVKLLRVLQEMEITRVGATKPIKINVRVIAASNRNLKDLVKEGDFREDLFYRLNVIPISIPPLRKRVEDIPLLISSYAKIFEAKYQRKILFTKEAMDELISYHWPGNVRELVNIVERTYVTTLNPTIKKEDILQVFGNKHEQVSYNRRGAVVVNEVVPLKEAVDELERQLIQKASKQEKSYRGIARVLEVNPSTIVRKVKRLEGGKQK